MKANFMKRLFVMAVCLLFAGGVMAVPSVQAADKVKIGVLQPLTGPLTMSGTLVTNGIKMAAEEVNAKGGVNIGGKKYPIELIIYDTKCVPKDSATATERLIIRDKVDLIIGDFCSSCCFVDAPVADKHKTVVISPTCAAGGLTQQGFNYFFRGGVHNFSGVATMMEVLKAEGIKKVVLLAVNDAWGRSYTTLYPPALKEAGIELLGVEYFEHGQKDYYTVLTKIKGMKADGVLACSEIEDFAPFVMQARETNPGLKIVETGGSDMNKIAELVPPKAAEGLKGVSRMPPPDKSIEAFNEAYRKKYGSEPSSFTYSGHDNLMVAVAALEKAGTLDDKEKIRQAFQDSDFQGFIGRYQFGPNGENYIPLGIQMVEGGKIKYAWIGDRDKLVEFIKKLMKQ
ncbi:MAG: ABC transporter substrate-binding protein [Proteobacteria bacterium]|nr:ABC transporter substrate-binding protein [Pseudomonadota bacterium]